MLTELSLSIPPAPSASGAARAAIRERFTGVLGRAIIADLELVISELVTNSFEHGRGAIRVDISHTDGEVNGAVSDQGNGFDYELRDVAGPGLRGRGLAITDALVARWGIRGGSTQVWFAMTLDAVESGRRPRGSRPRT
jgi:anti-sigma regulatory factor (Ser/Thr protein kinase)